MRAVLRQPPQLPRIGGCVGPCIRRPASPATHTCSRAAAVGCIGTGTANRSHQRPGPGGSVTGRCRYLSKQRIGCTPRPGIHGCPAVNRSTWSKSLLHPRCVSGAQMGADRAQPWAPARPASIKPRAPRLAALKSARTGLSRTPRRRRATPAPGSVFADIGDPPSPVGGPAYVAHPHVRATTGAAPRQVTDGSCAYGARSRTVMRALPSVQHCAE